MDFYNIPPDSFLTLDTEFISVFPVANSLLGLDGKSAVIETSKKFNVLHVTPKTVLIQFPGYGFAWVHKASIKIEKL